MEDQLVSLEVSQLAKEKGFNIYTKAWYYGDSLVEYGKNGIREMYQNNTVPDCTSAPTQSLLQKWLRDVHEIDITVMILEANGYKVYVHQKRNILDSRGITIHPKYDKVTFETALEAGLLYALNKI